MFQPCSLAKILLFFFSLEWSSNLIDHLSNIRTNSDPLFPLSYWVKNKKKRNRVRVRVGEVPKLVPLILFLLRRRPPFYLFLLRSPFFPSPSLSLFDPAQRTLFFKSPDHCHRRGMSIMGPRLKFLGPTVVLATGIRTPFSTMSKNPGQTRTRTKLGMSGTGLIVITY